MLTAADELPTFELQTNPGWLSSYDAPSLNATGAWLYPTSPSTPWRGPDSKKRMERYMLLDPRYRDADGRPGHDEWWFITGAPLMLTVTVVIVSLPRSARFIR